MLLSNVQLDEVVAARPPSAPRTPFLAAGNPRPVLRAACEGDAQGVLAVVLETEGSTYAHVGAMAYFAAERQVGWLSGGCLEPVLAEEAAKVAAAGIVGWMEIDTRGDEDLLSGSALGCRGRLRLALLPLQAMRGVDAMIETWLQGADELLFDLDAEGDVRVAAGTASVAMRLPSAPPAWHATRHAWSITVQRLPSALVLGAGPEAPALLRLLHELGWRTTLAERRPRWRNPDALVDRHVATIASAVADDADVALVMHHHFELDREALEALASTSIPFIGLLGPQRRRDDLFKLLTPQQRASFASRLHSPVGLPLGGQGPEAIALSIAAQLQAWRSTSQSQ